MKITLLQSDIVWADTSSNISKAESLLLSAPNSDLYVLPEMWSTGFAVSPDEIAENIRPDHNRALQWMVSSAVRHQCAIAGTIAVKDVEQYRNRMYFVMPDGSFCFYDKRHLFKYGGEGEYYIPGTERVTVDYKGVKFLLATCYDLRFPIWLRNYDEYDVLLVAANWPDKRMLAWNTLLPARAIENQAFVAAVNRVGEDQFCAYIGGSRIINAYGDVIAEAQGNTAQAVTATLDMQQLRHFRDKFPVLDDMDNINFDK
jgi:omega-amidase